MLGSSDSLDFRHHDYKAMRKVTPMTQEGGSAHLRSPAHQGITCYDCPRVPLHLTLFLTPKLLRFPLLWCLSYSDRSFLGSCPFLYCANGVPIVWALANF